MKFTIESLSAMTVADAQKLGVQQYRNGKTFADRNVRPEGFSLACILAKRADLLDALDYGWHTANRAEPVIVGTAGVVRVEHAERELQLILQS